jgi:hypothetical protein
MSHFVRIVNWMRSKLRICKPLKNPAGVRDSTRDLCRDIGTTLKYFKNLARIDGIF